MTDSSGWDDLIRGGLDPDDLRRVACGSAGAFERARKKAGTRQGPLGLTGVQVYEALVDEETGALERFVPLTVRDLAERCGLSRGATGQAIDRLVSNGFVEKRRTGTTSEFRALIRLAAVDDLVRYLRDFPIGSLGREADLPVALLAAKVLRPS